MKQEATTGSLEVGKRADLVVLDCDIFSVDPYKIGNTKVLRTYLDGQPVYSSPNERQGATPSTMKIPCAEPELRRDWLFRRGRSEIAHVCLARLSVCLLLALSRH